MKRTIYKDLLEWKNNSDRKPLMLFGARQVGKTYILKEFGTKEFENLIYINCYKNDAIKELFSGRIDVREIILSLSALTNEEIRPHKSLLFFDEAQEIPEVIAALKYFCEDAREYCVATAGSLLGVMNMENISFPTGKVNILKMYPMTFMEFLEALGETKKMELAETGRYTLMKALSNEYEKLLRQYYFVGGMPEAVKYFIEKSNPEGVRSIQKEILSSYYSDIAKHAGNITPRCRMVFDSIPSQLAKENKKFIFGALKKGARASEFELAIQWLVDAGLIYKVKRVTKPEMPLSFYSENNSFKLFMLDVGLMGAMAEVPPSVPLIGNNVFKEFKGSFTENYVATQLVTILPEKNITYHTKDNSRVEVDFIIQLKDKIIPIEVKAEENVRSKSFRQFLTVDNAELRLEGVRLSLKPYEEQDWMTNVPLYALLPFLDSLLRR